MHPLILSLLIFEAALLCAQALLVWARPQDPSRKRFLILVLAFFQFTLICGIMPSDIIPVNTAIQTIIVYLSSIALAYYYFRYLSVELELPQLKLYNIKVLAITLIFSFLFCFIVTFLITKDLYTSRLTFSIIPIIIAIYFCYQTIYFLFVKWRGLNTKNNHHSAIILSGNVGIVFMASMPITDIFDKTLEQTLNISLVSISLLSAFYAYVKNHVRQARQEFEFLQKLGFVESEGEINGHKTILKNYKLTARELDVALLILEAKSYREIGEEMFLNHKTISKHGSNIFRKTNCKNKSDFISHFSAPNGKS